MTVRIERLYVRRAIAIRLELARILPAFILAGYGVFILSLFTRHALTMYINPAYIWPSAAAGIVLLGLATVKIAGSRVQTGEDSCCSTAGDSACCASDDCGCDTTPKRLWPYLWLAFPLALAVLLPPRGLGVFSAQQRGISVAGAGLTAGHGALAAKRVSLSVDTRTFSFQDWMGALASDPNPHDYVGKPVIISGMVSHASSSAPPGYILLLRYQITCCIADARPEAMVVRDTSQGKLQDNQWAQARGVMAATSYLGQKLAVVEPKTLMQIKAGNPYMN